MPHGGGDSVAASRQKPTSTTSAARHVNTTYAPGTKPLLSEVLIVTGGAGAMGGCLIAIVCKLVVCREPALSRPATCQMLPSFMLPMGSDLGP